MSVRVRFAPSPTGLLHVGNIRIAVANYIYALQNNGEFLLRIDDTDKQRSTKEYEEAILEDLKWLGLPYHINARQSDNLSNYNAAFEKLKEAGIVYPCFETSEELNLARKLQLMHGKPPVYGRAALQLTKEQIDEYIASGRKPYWRFLLREDTSEWKDLVSGGAPILLQSISDPIVVKPDGSYVYTFASVVDDINMGITHIIRGCDHVTNTAAQISIFKALEADIPIFAHLPLLSSTDGNDISKRSGSNFSMRKLRENGAEPFAIVATLSSLGSSYTYKPGDTFKNVVNEFDFGRLSLSAPKFGTDSIFRLTKKVLANYSIEKVRDRIIEIAGNDNVDRLPDFWNAVKSNLNVFSDIKKWYDICFGDVVRYKTSKSDLVELALELLHDRLPWADLVKNIQESTQYKKPEIMHEIRLILTGEDTGPDLESLYNIIGADVVEKRFINSMN